MTNFEAISDFVDLYLSIDLSPKEMELIKVRCVAPAGEDPLKETVQSFRNVLEHTEKHYKKFRARSRYALPENLEELLHLSPQEFLLLLGNSRYQLQTDTLSLILREPIETLKFKYDHLRQRLQLSDEALQEIHLQLQPLETKRYSQIQKLKSKLRPQKFLLETTVIMIGVITLLWSLPELRNRYEKWIQRKTTEYFISGELKDSPLPAEYANKTPPVIADETEATDTPTEDESQIKTERKQPKVTEGEVWRFSFTGSAKIDLESELKKLLQKYSDQPPKSSVAPGGIQYDVFVKASDLISLKQDYESLSDAQSHTLKMSWYKKKSMGTKKVPSGYVEVIVWISTI